jgi:hypothetical protein
MFVSQTMFSNMAMAHGAWRMAHGAWRMAHGALYFVCRLKIWTMHPRATRGQHNHPPLGHFRFSLLVTAIVADGVSPTHHTVRVTF